MSPMEVKNNSNIDQQVNTKDGKRRNRFLDRFAELVSYQKAAEQVSCTMLREKEDYVEIWVSRNAGLNRVQDLNFFRQFERLMPDVCRNEEGEL